MNINLTSTIHALIFFRKPKGESVLPLRIHNISNGNTSEEGCVVLNEYCWLIDLNKGLHIFCESINVCQKNQVEYSVLFLNDMPSFINPPYENE